MDSRFALHNLLEFVFPPSSLYVLANSRLYAFALYGPLNHSNQLCTSSFKNKRPLLDYELNQICQRIEREDLISIYLHNTRQLASLSLSEEEMIISKADKHLKVYPGKAFLPQINKQDVVNLLKNISCNSSEELSFHEAQTLILNFRKSRIQQLKLMYPQITPEVNENNIPKKKKSSGKISKSTVPSTMFMKLEGLRNADLIEETTDLLNKNKFKISSIDYSINSDAAVNVRLLRDVGVAFQDPYIQKNGTRIKDAWNSTYGMKGVIPGSKINCAPSSTTSKIKYTSY